MESDTPLSPLVLWVPPAVAAAWEHLPAERQAAFTQELTTWLTSRLLPPPPPQSDRTMEWINGLSVAELKAFVEDLERKFRQQADGGTP